MTTVVMAVDGLLQCPRQPFSHANTCYINAVIQCFYHCAPFRLDLEQQATGSSFMGDRMKDLWTTYKRDTATKDEMSVPLTELVLQILRHANFEGADSRMPRNCACEFSIALTMD